MWLRLGKILTVRSHHLGEDGATARGLCKVEMSSLKIKRGPGETTNQRTREI